MSNKQQTRSAARLPAAPPKAKPDATDVGLRVVARGTSFRRAGFAFSAEPTVLALSELSDAQYEALTNESMLACSLQPLEPQAEGADDTKA